MSSSHYKEHICRNGIWRDRIHETGAPKNDYKKNIGGNSQLSIRLEVT
jgi:hypothetical protein